jgi:aspartyl/asparaginyl beta-hydroxylase (cupin superfamily)
MFYDRTLFPFTSQLESDWRVVREELDALVSGDFIAWPEHSIYGDSGWDTFGLYAFGQRQAEGCRRCRRTDAIVRRIPGLMMAGFSRLAPGAHIKPHRGYEGYAGYVLRLHLALDVPGQCSIRVSDETRSWEEGRCLVFDDSFEHEAWNHAERPRTVLLIDFLNPLRRRPLILNPQFTPELIRFIEREHLPHQHIGQRALWYIWKIFNRRLVRAAQDNKAHDHPV